ncbi:S8 family serine peptidase [Jatrophihabitans endophyticus]|uniref:S8 family serine peptidase n=1 Tax=Jatrophihabitans endophyticus TaxID=1206085 RepID=UPI0019EE4FAB|nr:S8 family serine peptidase [Jatrophihabitans endophyticus]MBE7186691.1 S8 family serine peptidase [Jatrophihabitans endophyticus]
MTRTARALLALVAVVGLGLGCAAPALAANPPNVVGTSVLSHAQVQAKEWWLVRLSLHKAWKITRGAGVTVAVMDTGVDPKFGDLRGALVPGFGVDTHATGDTDAAYHGTRIADEIAGRGTGFGLLGIAPAAKVMPVTVPGSAGSAAVAAALNHLASMPRPPQVVNMSFGGPFPCPSDVAAATRKAAAAGLVLVAGAGNSAATGNLSQYPADCPGVVAVGAVNTHAGAWSMSQRRPYVTLSGPGVHMIGYDRHARSGYGFADGTSDAAAMVSGVAALVRAHRPSMSARDVVTRLLATTHQFAGEQGTRNNRYGYGVALPYNALTRHVPAGAPDPVYAALAPKPRPSGSTSTAPGSSAPSSAPSSGAGSGPSSSPPAAGASASSSGSNGTSIGLVVAIVVVVLALVAVVVAVTLRGRRRAMRRLGP